MYSQSRYFESKISEIFFNITRIRRNDESKIDSRRKANETIAIRFLNEGITACKTRAKPNRWIISLVRCSTPRNFSFRDYSGEHNWSKKEFSNTSSVVRSHAGLYVKSTTLHNRKINVPRDLSYLEWYHLNRGRTSFFIL